MRLPDHAPPVIAFIALGALPAVLIVAGSGGGAAVWLALGWIALAAPAADVALGRGFRDAAPGRVFAGTQAGLAVLALCHAAVLLATLAALGGAGLRGGERVALFVAAGLYFGQISNAAAHEMIHARARPLFWAGAAIYTSLLFGQHVSAHRLVHHRHVATAADPNSAPLGMSFWRFWPRATLGAFRAGLAAERARGAGRAGRLNPYWLWLGGGLGCVGAVAAGFGGRALVDYLGLCLYAQMQLHLSDYVQHYGLRRAVSKGRAAPPGPRHSWDSPHPLSSLAMVNAPRHSDHHAHPMRPFPALRLAREAAPRPMLPWPLPVMGAIAMVPPLWRRVMDGRVARMVNRPSGP